MTCYVKCTINNSFQSPVKWVLYESHVLDEKAETQRCYRIQPNYTYDIWWRDLSTILFYSKPTAPYNYIKCAWK